VKSAPLVPTSRIVAFGRQGNDSIKLASSLPIAAHLFGDVGNDTLTGSAGPDLIFGGENNDTINGSTGDNRLFGENGDDIISASSGHDVIYGGAGLDKISGSTGNNLLFGEAGNDTITGAGVLVGGLDNDTLTPASSRSIAIGGLGADILKSASKKGDLLIGGTTDFDTNENALRSLHSEWASANPVQVRIDHLTGLLPGGSNGTNLLISDAVRSGTVHNDGVNDTFTNNFADDWAAAVRRGYSDEDHRPGEPPVDERQRLDIMKAPRLQPGGFFHGRAMETRDRVRRFRFLLLKTNPPCSGGGIGPHLGGESPDGWLVSQRI
jgi:Ca2+-binding RTX toxin-like protein